MSQWVSAGAPAKQRAPLLSQPFRKPHQGSGILRHAGPLDLSYRTASPGPPSARPPPPPGEHDTYPVSSGQVGLEMVTSQDSSLCRTGSSSPCRPSPKYAGGARSEKRQSTYLAHPYMRTCTVGRPVGPPPLLPQHVLCQSTP